MSSTSMVVRYAPIPNPRTEPDTNPELNAAFDGSDDEGADESQPLNSDQPSPPRLTGCLQEQTLTYDFDSPIPDYDHPPPGSPPPPTGYALPNTIGNTNGNIPVFTPDNVPRPPTRWWKRTASAVLPSYYVSRFGLDAQSSSSGTQGHVLGGGMGNDGVFRNMAAKPSTTGIRVQDGDSIYVVPEESSATSPPSYAAAQADAVPPYHTSTLLLPSNGGPLTQGSVMVEALPTGTLFIFLWNALVSTTFQIVGFVLTWAMSTTHAARFGSRAGLGVTLIQWGLGLRARLDEAGSWGRPTFATAKEADEYYQSIGLFNSSSSELPPTPTQPTAPDESQMDDTWPGDSVLTSPMAIEWLSFLFMTAGWFLLLTSGLGFWRVKRWEKSILAPSAPASDPPPPATQDHTRSLSEIDADTEMSWESFLAPLVERARYHRLSQQDDAHVSADSGGEQQEGSTGETIQRVRAMREELRSMGVL